MDIFPENARQPLQKPRVLHLKMQHSPAGQDKKERTTLLAGEFVSLFATHIRHTIHMSSIVQALVYFGSMFAMCHGVLFLMGVGLADSESDSIVLEGLKLSKVDDQKKLAFAC